MRSHRRAVAVALAPLIAIVGCTLAPIGTPEPAPTPALTASPARPPTPSPSPTVAPEPTPNAGAIPRFGAGEVIVTTIDGLRVRQRPGTTSVVIAGLLPVNAALEVVMGPILVDEIGWYLVRDADPDEPEFGESWIAAGFDPEAYLASTGTANEGSPLIASFAQTGDADYGPIEIGDGDHAIRWIALDPERVRCHFAVLLAAGSADPVPAIRATVGSGVDPGILQPGSFAALGVRGQAFVTVESDCAWALVVMRVPDPTPGATP